MCATFRRVATDTARRAVGPWTPAELLVVAAVS